MGEPKGKLRGLPGSTHPNWKGGRFIGHGYVFIYSPNHHRANFKGYVREHILIAEKALGKPLPEGACVHHANGSRDSGPIVICQDNTYHMLLEQRTRAFNACGHATWRKCKFCQRYDPPEKLYIGPKCGAFHRDCQNEYKRRGHG